MNKDEAQKLLAAWDFFDKNPQARSWEGINRERFYELVAILSGEEDLVAARAYLEKILAGDIHETVPQKLVEAVKKGELPEERIDQHKEVSQATQEWIAKLSAKQRTEAAAKEVSAAKLATLVDLNTAPEEVFPQESAPSAPPIRFSPKTTGVEAQKDYVPKTGVSISSKDVPSQVSFQNAIRGGSFRLAAAPFNLVGRIGAAMVAESDPQKAAAINTMVSGVGPNMLLNMKAQAYASGMSREQLNNLARAMREVPAGAVMRAVTGRATWAEIVEIAYAGRQVNISPWQIGQMFGQNTLVASKNGQSMIIHPSIVGDVVTGIGNRLLGKGASFLFKQLVGKGAVAAGTGVTGTVVGAGTGVAVGGPFAPLTALAGAAISYIASKIPDLVSWFKRHIKDFGGAAVALFAGGIFLGSPILLGAGGGLGALVMGAGGTRALTAGAKAGVSTLFKGLAVLVLPSLALPLTIAFISIPVMIAFIYLVINSGAMLNPKEVIPIFPAVANPYLDVRISASPTTLYANSDLPVTIQYKVDITSKKDSLTNIRFEDICEVVKDTSTLACPQVTIVDAEGKSVPLGDQGNMALEPGRTYSLTFSKTYASQALADSVISESFKVVADSLDKKGISEIGTSSIIIGNPPTGCFTFDGNWPMDAKVNEIGAIAALKGISDYNSKLCGSGPISLNYDPNQYPNAGGHIIGLKNIGIYPLGTSTNFGTFYTLAHESGHVLAQTTNLYSQFIDSPGIRDEGQICTYPFYSAGAYNSSEDFAETIALYLSKKAGSQVDRFSCLDGANFKEKYPNHWEFVNSNIVSQTLGW